MFRKAGFLTIRDLLRWERASPEMDEFGADDSHGMPYGASQQSSETLC